MVHCLQPIADHLKEGSSSRKVTLCTKHAPASRHRAWKLERNARSNINWSADGCSFGAPEIGRSESPSSASPIQLITKSDPADVVIATSEIEALIAIRKNLRIG